MGGGGGVVVGKGVGNDYISCFQFGRQCFPNTFITHQSYKEL